MKKRIFSALLAAMFAIGMTACSSTPAEDASTQTQSTQTEADLTDWAYIQDKGEMVIGITYFEPMNYLTESGELTGFETEFAQAVCEKLGVEPVFQEISWSAKETELNAKNIDCIWNGLTIDEERLQNMSISQPYMENNQVLVVKSENAAAAAQSVDGLTIVAEAGSAGEDIATTEEFFANASFTPVDTMAKALMEVAAGTADACVIDYVTSIGMIGEGTDYADLVPVGDRTFGEEQYGIAMRKADTQLTAKVNDAINQLIEDGTLMTIAEEYKLGELLIVE